MVSVMVLGGDMPWLRKMTLCQCLHSELQSLGMYPLRPNTKLQHSFWQRKPVPLGLPQHPIKMPA